MQFTTSFFNPTLFRYNLKRYWPLAAAVFVVAILYPGMGILRAPAFAGFDESVAHYVLGIVYVAGPVMVGFMAPASLLAALLVFDHLRKRSKIRFHHGLPLTRLASFTTNYVCGFALIAVPLVVALLASMGMAVSVGAPEAVPAIARLIGVSLVCLLLFFSMAAIACIVCGNALGSILVYIAMNCVVVVLLLGFGALISALMPGVDISTIIEGPARWLTPIFQLVTGLLVNWDHIGSAPAPFDNPTCIIVYLVVGIILLVLAAWLYRARKDETAGETVAFRVARVICKVLFALVVSAIGASIVIIVGYGDTPSPTLVVPALIAHIIFAIIGWFMAEMIANRSLRVIRKRSLLSCAILVAAIIVATGLVSADVLGIVHKVPDPQRVEQVTVEYAGRVIEMDPADATKLHEAMIDTIGADEMDDASSPYGLYSDYDSVSFKYTMNNGTTMHRAYRIIYGPDKRNARDDALVDALDTPQYTHELFFNAKPGAITEDNIDWLTVNLPADSIDEANTIAADADEGDPGWTTYSFEGKPAYQLYRAICSDIDKGNISAESFVYSGQYPVAGDLEISWDGDSGDDPDDAEYASITITVGMEDTLAWINANKGKAV